MNELNNILIEADENINIFNEEIKVLKIKVKTGVTAVINDFRIINEEDTEIEFDLEKDANLIYNHSYINNGDYNLSIDAKFIDKGSHIQINIHGINDKGSTNLKIDGKIGKKEYNNFLLENIRLININDGKAKVMPNMLINNSRVIANHNVTIGKLNDNELEYLMSKGISKEASKKLILNGFLVDIITDNEMKRKIKELIGR